MTAYLIMLAEGYYNEATGDYDPGWAVLIGVLFFPVLVAVTVIYWRLKAAKQNEETIGKLQKKIIELENSNTSKSQVPESPQRTSQLKQNRHYDCRIVVSPSDSTDVKVQPSRKLTKQDQDGLIKAVRGIMNDKTLIEISKNRPPMSWDDLTHKLTRKYRSAEEVEQEHMVSNPALGNQPVPFGFNNNQWRELLASMESGDELWSFTTSDASWDNGCGRSGISLVRNGKEVSCIIEKMN